MKKRRFDCRGLKRCVWEAQRRDHPAGRLPPCMILAGGRYFGMSLWVAVRGGIFRGSYLYPSYL